jgi:hypothetical protein
VYSEKSGIDTGVGESIVSGMKKRNFENLIDQKLIFVIS